MTTHVKMLCFKHDKIYYKTNLKKLINKYYKMCSTMITKECWICLATNNQDEFISPCTCLGTVKLVHHNCLYKWLKLNRMSNLLKIKCSICKQTLQIEKFNYSYPKYIPL